MKYAIGPRREIGIRTIFNIVGPLSNPAGATHQLVGVFDKSLLKLFAEVLKSLGSKQALVVHGNDGLDEITTTTSTNIAQLSKSGEIRQYVIEPEEFGIRRAEMDELKGGNDEENAVIITNILGGEIGAKSDCAILNAGAAIYIAELADTIQEGIEKARESISSGAATKKLDELIKATKI